MVHIIGNHNSVFNEYIAEIRDENIQKDSMRFRRNLERAGEICAYEISKKLEWVKKEVERIICISKATKKDAIEILKIPEERLVVVYPGL